MGLAREEFPKIPQTGFEFWRSGCRSLLLSPGELSWPKLVVISHNNGESSKPLLKSNVYLTEEGSLPRKWHRVFVTEHRPGQARA